MSARSPRHSILASLVLALVGAALTGCAIGEDLGPLSDIERPAPGLPVSDAAQLEIAEQQGLSEFAGRLWLLPGWFSGEWMVVSPEGDSLRRSEFAACNLGFGVLPLLPLWISNESRIDGSSGGATSSMLWTPLCCGSSTSDWPDDEPTLRAWGLPLLYSCIDYARPGERPLLEFNATLWTLGPTWFRVDVDEQLDGLQVGPGDPEHAHGWVFEPLGAAGLGSWIWISAEFESSTVDMSAHGPLNGWLGYQFEDDHVERELSRKLIGGVLWYDVEERDDEDAVYSSRHGPLWGMFGWGLDNSRRPCLRVLWMPIPIGSASR